MPYILKIPVYLETNEYGHEHFDHKTVIVSDNTQINIAMKKLKKNGFEMAYSELDNEIAFELDTYWFNIFVGLSESDQIRLTKFFGMVPVDVICRIANGSTIDEEIEDYLAEEYRKTNIHFACVERILAYATRDYNKVNGAKYSCFLEFAIKNMWEFKKKYYTVYWGTNFYYKTDAEKHLSQLLNRQVVLNNANILKLEAELDVTVPNWKYRFFELALTYMSQQKQLNYYDFDDSMNFCAIAFIEKWPDFVIV